AGFSQQRNGVGNGLRNIAATEHVGIGKAIDEVDDQQAYRSLELELGTKALTRIRLNVVLTHYYSSITLPLRTASLPSSRTEQLRRGMSIWQAVVRLPPASLLGPSENRKLPSYARASMAMLCSLSYRPMVVQLQRGCRP